MLNEFGANLSATGDNDLEAEQIWSSWHDSFRMIRMEERPGNLVSTMYHLTWKQGRSAFGNTDNEDYVKCLQSLECSTRCSDFQARSTDLANRAEVTGRKIDGSGFESQKPMKINDRSLVAILLANPRTCATARFQVRGARQVHQAVPWPFSGHLLESDMRRVIQGERGNARELRWLNASTQFQIPGWLPWASWTPSCAMLSCGLKTKPVLGVLGGLTM